MKLCCMFFAAAMALSSVACSGASSVGGPLDACTLIGPQRAGAILGKAVTVKHVGPTPTKASDASECVYMTGSVNGGFLLVAARLGFDDAGAEARSQIAVSRQEQPPPGIPGTKVRMVEGPGQAAYLGTSTNMTQLHVLDHGVSLVVSINQPDSPALRARTRKLAQAALDGIGRE